MKRILGFGKICLERRAMLPVIYGACALGIFVALLPGGAGRGATAPATRPAAASPADKAAAAAEFDKASALYQQKNYAEAQIENEKALQLDPTNMNAILMRGVLKTYLAGGAGGAGAGGGAATAPKATTIAAGGGGVGNKIPLLTMQQISMIRLMEWGPADGRVTGKIDPKVLEDFWLNVVLKDDLADKSKAAHDAFVNPNNFMAQARRIRDSRDMKYMQQITMNTDPAAFLAYKGGVQTWVLQSCAAAECHGGEKAPGGSFRLLNPAATVEQQYTNFYILSMYANVEGQMVDRVNSDKSLLIQYALPWENAAAKHPQVETRKLSGVADARIRPILGWINGLGFARPNYGISYYVPGVGGAGGVGGTAAIPAPASASAPATKGAPATTRGK